MANPPTVQPIVMRSFLGSIEDRGTQVPPGWIRKANESLRKIAAQWNKYAKQRIEELEEESPSHYLEKLKLHLFLNPVPFTAESIKNPRARQALGLFADSQFEIHETTIRTVIDVLCGSISSKRWAAIVGALQSGKSEVLALLACIEPLVRTLVYGKKHIPIINLTRHNDLFEQIQLSVGNMFSAMSRFTLSNVEETISEAFILTMEGLASGIKNLSDTIVKNNRTVEFDSPEDFFSKNTKGQSGVGWGRKILDIVKSHEGRCVAMFYCDECHWGNNVDGVKGKAYKSEWRNGNELFIVRNLSATPFEQMIYQPFYHWIGPGYHGLPYFNGVACPTIPGYVKSLPVLGSYKTFAKPMIYGLVYTAIPNYNSYLKNVLGLRNGDYRRAVQRQTFNYEWSNYRAYFVEQIANIIAHGIRQGHTGQIIRLARENSLANEIVSELKRRLKNVEFVMYMTNQTRSLNIEPNGNTVIVVTGSARMGCRVPHWVTLGLDLTHSSSTATAELQGLFGRLNGYGKKSTILLSDSGLESLKYYYRSCGRVSKPVPRATVGEVRGRPRIYVYVIREWVEYAHRFRQDIDKQDTGEMLKILDSFDKELRSQKGNNPSIVRSKVDPLPFTAGMQRMIEITEKNPQLVVFPPNSPEKGIEHCRVAFSDLDLLYIQGSDEKTLTEHNRKQKPPRAWPYSVSEGGGCEILKRSSTPKARTNAGEGAITSGLELLRYIHGEDKGQRLQSRSVSRGTEDSFSPVMWIDEDGGAPPRVLGMVFVCRTNHTPEIDVNYSPTDESLDFEDSESDYVD